MLHAVMLHAACCLLCCAANDPAGCVSWIDRSICAKCGRSYAAAIALAAALTRACVSLCDYVQRGLQLNQTTVMDELGKALTSLTSLAAQPAVAAAHAGPAVGAAHFVKPPSLRDQFEEVAVVPVQQQQAMPSMQAPPQPVPQQQQSAKAIEGEDLADEAKRALLDEPTLSIPREVVGIGDPLGRMLFERLFTERPSVTAAAAPVPVQMWQG